MASRLRMARIYARPLLSISHHRLQTHSSTGVPVQTCPPSPLSLRAAEVASWINEARAMNIDVVTRPGFAGATIEIRTAIQSVLNTAQTTSDVVNAARLIYEDYIPANADYFASFVRHPLIVSDEVARRELWTLVAETWKLQYGQGRFFVAVLHSIAQQVSSCRPAPYVWNEDDDVGKIDGPTEVADGDGPAPAFSDADVALMEHLIDRIQLEQTPLPTPILQAVMEAIAVVAEVRYSAHQGEALCHALSLFMLFAAYNRDVAGNPSNCPAPSARAIERIALLIESGESRESKPFALLKQVVRVFSIKTLGPFKRLPGAWLPRLQQAEPRVLRLHVFPLYKSEAVAYWLDWFRKECYPLHFDRHTTQTRSNYWPAVPPYTPPGERIHRSQDVETMTSPLDEVENAMAELIARNKKERMQKFDQAETSSTQLSARAGEIPDSMLIGPALRLRQSPSLWERLGGERSSMFANAAPLPTAIWNRKRSNI